MQRKAYVSGVAALLAALLAGCTGSSADGGSTDDSNPGDSGTTQATAEPGRYRTLPEACGAVSQDTLDLLLPGIREMADEAQQEKAYEGSATLTYDTDRKVGCRWKVESSDATDHLFVNFDRVVSYDNAVSDDSEAEQVFATKQAAANLPAPATSGPDTEESPSPSATPSDSASASVSASASTSPSGSSSESGSASPSGPPADLQPRTLDDLGDEAFLNDVLGSAGSTARQRTVTVAFRTSNVIVTIQYEEQPTTIGVVPDSKEMQDRARKLAAELAGSLGG